MIKHMSAFAVSTVKVAGLLPDRDLLATSLTRSTANLVIDVRFVVPQPREMRTGQGARAR